MSSAAPARRICVCVASIGRGRLVDERGPEGFCRREGRRRPTAGQDGRNQDREGQSLGVVACGWAASKGTSQGRQAVTPAPDLEWTLLFLPSTRFSSSPATDHLRLLAVSKHAANHRPECRDRAAGHAWGWRHARATQTLNLQSTLGSTAQSSQPLHQPLSHHGPVRPGRSRTLTKHRCTPGCGWCCSASPNPAPKLCEYIPPCCRDQTISCYYG